MTNAYHLIGIGGIGMSALARILHQRGYFVQGSDQKESSLLDELKKEGISIHIGHNEALVNPGMQVVFSSDVKGHNVELIQARKLGLSLLHRADLLNFCMEGKKGLLVAGTHGKTTTTTLLAYLLSEAGLDPSFVIGGIACNFGTNGRFGQGEYFVAETDESDGSFLKSKAFGAIVTNIDDDHLSYWKNSEALDFGFKGFISQVMEPKYFFWCADNIRLRNLKPLGQSYGFSEDADWHISFSKPSGQGMVFDLFHKGKKYPRIEMSLLGQHNVLNATAAFALALSLGAEESVLRRALISFSGSKRRLEWKKTVKEIQLFDDYGHHPVEIRATLSALRGKIGKKRLVVVFQPHRYTRVQELLEEFCASFLEADLVILTDIYAAGEELIEGLFILLHKKMESSLTGRFHYFSYAQLAEKTALQLCPHDVLLTIGAGDITYMGERILQYL